MGMDCQRPSSTVEVLTGSATTLGSFLCVPWCGSSRIPWVIRIVVHHQDRVPSSQAVAGWAGKVYGYHLNHANSVYKIDAIIWWVMLDHS